MNNIKTNADVIRQMTNEQLARFIDTVEIGDLDYSITFCNMCKGVGNVLNLDCDGCLRHWLNANAGDTFGLLGGNYNEIFDEEVASKQ